jgi:hypothetical protein
MPEQDSAPRGGRLSWWPKLMLWGIVIAFGVVYLGSTKRQADEARTSAEPPVQTSAESASGPGSPAAMGPGTSATAPPEGAAPTPVQAAESAAFARSLMSTETDPEAASEEIAAPAGSGEVAPGTAPVAGASVPMTSPPPPPLPGTMPSAAPAGVPDAPPAGAERATADAVAPPAAPADALEAERRRILEQYQTMRRAAEGQMPQPWGPGMVPPPYGYPGYGPGAYPGR